jgi:hypothetical protein
MVIVTGVQELVAGAGPEPFSSAQEVINRIDARNVEI